MTRRWPWRNQVPVRRGDDPRQAQLLRGLGVLDELTRMLNDVVAEVQEGDLGAGERRG